MEDHSTHRVTFILKVGYRNTWAYFSPAFISAHELESAVTERPDFTRRAHAPKFWTYNKFGRVDHVKIKGRKKEKKKENLDWMELIVLSYVIAGGLRWLSKIVENQLNVVIKIHLGGIEP